MKRSPGLPFIFVTLFLDMLGLGLLVPITPQLVAQLVGADGAARSYGLLIGLFALVQLLCSPTLGAVSDRVGRRPVLLLSSLLAALSYVLAARAASLELLLAARALGGLAAANVPVAQAYIVDVSRPEDRTRNFGLVGAAFGLGLIVGPAVGGLLGQFDLRLPFYFAAGLAALNFLYGLFVLPESRPAEARAARLDPLAWIPLRSLGLLAQVPALLPLSAVLLLSSLAFQFVISTWVLAGTARYGWSAGASGLSLAAGGVLGILVQVVALPRLVRRLGPAGTAALALGAGVVGSALYGLAVQEWMLYASMPVMSLFGLSGPALQALVAGHTSPSAQGAVQGALASLNALAGVAGPLAATALFSHFVAAGAAPSLPGAADFAAASLLLVSLGVFWVTSRRNPLRASFPQGEVQ